jgi:anaerobic selenocysteine-containing dehydrogenase
VERTFTCNLCECLCGLRVKVDGAQVVEVRGDPDDVLSQGHICPKAVALKELFHDPQRLRAPLRRTATGFVPVSWDEALDDIALRLRTLQAAHGHDSVALYVGNPAVHSHRTALGSLVLGGGLGTRYRYDPNSQDSNPRLFACMQVYGDALSMPIPDIERTRYLLMLGANPAASQGSQMVLGNPRARLSGIRARGGKIVLIDPRRTESAEWASEHHFIRPGGDAALLLALLQVLFDERRIDLEQLERIARGVDALAELARPFTPERVGPVVGIAPEVIRRLASELADEPMGSVYARVGVCQNEFGPLAAWLVEVLNVVLGRFDKEGGVMFARPAADIAPLARALIGNQFGRWHSKVRGLPELFGSLPSATMAEDIEAGGPRALVVYAGNPVASTPNGERLARALERLELVVSIDFYLNETSRHAHYVLPAKHIFETGNYDLLLSRFTVRNVAKYSPPIVDAGDLCRDDFDLALELAARVRLGRALPAGLARRLSRAPERIIDWLLRLGPNRLSLDALRAAEHGVDLGPLQRTTQQRVFHRGGRIELVPEPLTRDLPRLEQWLAKGRPALVLIGRRHLRSNNSWMNDLASLAKGPDRTRLLIHPLDAAPLGPTGTRVRVQSRAGALIATLEVSEKMMPGVVSLPHGFHQPSANALTDEQFVEPVLGTSILNGVEVQLARAD